MVQFNSVAQSCPTLCNPMDCSMPGFPVYHQLLELAQTQVHCRDIESSYRRLMNENKELKEQIAIMDAALLSNEQDKEELS